MRWKLEARNQDAIQTRVNHKQKQQEVLFLLIKSIKNSLLTTKTHSLKEENTFNYPFAFSDIVLRKGFWSETRQKSTKRGHAY